MLTYQDLINIPPDDAQKRLAFVQSVIFEHKASELYETAVIAEEYNRKRNRTIIEFQKLLYSLNGTAVPDTMSANYKLTSSFFNRFIVQENQYLLGNGVTWKKSESAKKLGEDFDIKLQKAGLYALSGGVSFGFYNNDKVEVFKVLEFAPLWDEETGALSAGVRFWQIDSSKPMRATLYETDGYTEYIWGQRDSLGKVNNGGMILKEKQPYKIITKQVGTGEKEIVDGENYPSFPIVPLWGNPFHLSELVGLRESIDAYDLIKSGFCNTIDEANIIYWLIQGAGGMDDMDLTEFLARVRRTHAAAPQEGQTVDAKTIDPPVKGREILLNRISADLYRDAMALDTEKIAAGAVTATQIKAAYEPLNNKVDQFEYCVLEFLSHIMELAGIDDEPSFTRSMLVNAQETAQIVLQGAQHFGEEYVTRKLLTLLGDGDQADEVLKRMAADELIRGNVVNAEAEQDERQLLNNTDKKAEEE